jgi:hypothetical protein
MRNILIAIVVAIDFLANLPYIFDALKGRTKPNLASWSTWTLINFIVVIAALASGGAMNTVLLAASYAAGSTAILIIALVRGTRKYTLFDGICQVIALGGIVLWRLIDDPNAALLTVIFVDVFAVLPTIRHAHKYPYEETWLTFAFAAVGAFLLTLLATSASFAALAFPIEAAVVNGGLAGLILYRRKQVGPAPAKAA